MDKLKTTYVQKCLRIEAGKHDKLAAVPQHVGHGHVEPKDVEHGQDAEGDLLPPHELHLGRLELGHVGNQVAVG